MFTTVLTVQFTDWLLIGNALNNRIKIKKIHHWFPNGHEKSGSRHVPIILWFMPHVWILFNAKVLNLEIWKIYSEIFKINHGIIIWTISFIIYLWNIILRKMQRFVIRYFYIKFFTEFYSNSTLKQIKADIREFIQANFQKFRMWRQGDPRPLEHCAHSHKRSSTRRLSPVYAWLVAGFCELF